MFVPFIPMPARQRSSLNQNLSGDVEKKEYYMPYVPEFTWREYLMIAITVLVLQESESCVVTEFRSYQAIPKEVAQGVVIIFTCTST
jgi:hypothetical protein